jgi:phage-related minor tail protein
MARDAFSSFSNGMDKLIDTFVTTGKLSFGDFAKSVIADLIKIELKAQAMSALKMLTGGNGISGAMSTIGRFFGGFFAEGGQPPLGKASIVGEKGPELFVPKSAGTIIPNGGFGGATVQQPIINNNTYVTNNVSAVDAKSVAQLFQENRKQLFGVIETARKEMPGRTR